jgi:hypothetical protein
VEAIVSWSGDLADTLREALRMTNESFAERLGVAVRTVANWRGRPDVVPAAATQAILDTALAQAPELARARFERLLADRARNRELAAGSALPSAADDAGSLMAWLTASDASDEAIGSLDRLAAALAEAHTQVAAGTILTEVSQLERTAEDMLRTGRPRHSQARELLRISGGLLAHQSLLLSDLNDYQAAGACGQTALMCLREAGASEVTAWYVLAKNARWQQHYLEAADQASQGLQRSSPGPMRVQLACYEANASALLGDKYRARTAMTRAEEAAAALPASLITLSPWSFPPDRMTIFRVSVALGTGDPDAALRAAAAASPVWEPGGPQVPAAWAQIRIGAGIACLLRDELDGTAEQIAPMLALPAEFRIATVTGWLASLDRRLAGARFARNPLAADLRQQIRDFSAAAPTASSTREDR